MSSRKLKSNTDPGLNAIPKTYRSKPTKKPSMDPEKLSREMVEILNGMRYCHTDMDSVTSIISRGWTLQCPNPMSVIVVAHNTHDPDIIIKILSTGSSRDLGRKYELFVAVLFSAFKYRSDMLQVLIWMRNAGWQLTDEIPLSHVISWSHLSYPILHVLFGCDNGESAEEAKMWWKPEDYTLQILNDLVTPSRQNDPKIVEILIRNASTVRELAAVDAFIAANPQFEYLHDRREVSARPDL